MAAVETLYRVASGDSLSKIAQKFYGDAQAYPRIATANNLNPSATLYIGQPLRIPPDVLTEDELQEVRITAQRLPTAVAPASPGGSLVDPTTGIETVTVAAYVWYKDWRWYVAGAGVAFLLWYLNSNRGRR